MAEVVPMLKAIHAGEDRETDNEKGARVKEYLLAMRLGTASIILEAVLEESPSYMSFPRKYKIRIRTNNAMERLNQGDPKKNKGCRKLPRQPVRPHARCC